MPEDFKIEAINANGLPITPPQDTRSEEGYLKNLTVQGLLKVLTGGKIENDDGDYRLDENGLSMLAVSETLAAGPNKLTWRTVSNDSLLEVYGVFEQNTEFPPDDNSQLYLYLKFLTGDTRMVLVRGASIEIENRLFVLSTLDSTSKDTGSIVTEGGIGVEKSAHIGANLRVLGTTDSTSPTTGSSVLSGGLGVAKNLAVGGSLYLKSFKYIDTTIDPATYTVASGISTVLVEDSISNSGVTITLPSATGTGRVILIKDVGGSAGTTNITINASGGQVIDGATSATISTNYGSMRLIDGANNFYYII